MLLIINEVSIAVVVLHFVLHRTQKCIICDIFIEQAINSYNPQTRINATFQRFCGFVSFYFDGFDSRYLLLMKSLVNAGKTSVLQGFSRVLRLFKRKPFKKNR